MASRNLHDLHPKLMGLAFQHRDMCEAAGIDLLIYCTFRSEAEQASLYAQGRTKPGKIVTYAKPGASKHNHMEGARAASLEYDCVPLIDGKPMWNPKHESWQIVGSIGKSLGLEWAGDWKRFKEYPHFQITLDNA